MRKDLMERAQEIVAELKEECTDCSERHWCDSGTNGVGIYCPVQDAADLIEQLTAEPPNDQLTLEELRGMDREPVYIVRGRGGEGRAVVGVEDGALYFHGPDFEDDPDEDFYGMTCANTTCSQPCKHGLHQLGWLAYRRKPDGGGE